jgi:hypothetical protein
MAANPGTARAESIRFLEADGNAAGGLAGTWTGNVVIPAGACLVDVIVYGTALWTATTSATLTVGDTTDPDGYYTGVNLKATDLTAGQALNFAMAGGKHGAYLEDAATAGSQVSKNYSTAERTVTAAVVTVGAPVTTRPGDTTVTFLYTYAAPVKPTFVTA